MTFSPNIYFNFMFVVIRVDKKFLQLIHIENNFEKLIKINWNNAEYWTVIKFEDKENGRFYNLY